MSLKVMSPVLNVSSNVISKIVISKVIISIVAVPRAIGIERLGWALII
jgi:hypothetical protein